MAASQHSNLDFCSSEQFSSTAVFFFSLSIFLKNEIALIINKIITFCGQCEKYLGYCKWWNIMEGLTLVWATMKALMRASKPCRREGTAWISWTRSPLWGLRTTWHCASNYMGLGLGVFIQGPQLSSKNLKGSCNFPLKSPKPQIRLKR